MLHSGSANLCVESGADLAQDNRWQDAGDLAFDEHTPAFDRIERTVGRILDRGARVLSLGGDHSVTYPILRAYGARYAGLTLLHLDAHPDLYDAYDGNRLANACPFARIMEEGLAVRLVQAGIRTMNPHQRRQAERFGVETLEMRHWATGLAPGPRRSGLPVPWIWTPWTRLLRPGCPTTNPADFPPGTFWASSSPCRPRWWARISSNSTRGATPAGITAHGRCQTAQGNRRPDAGTAAAPVKITGRRHFLSSPPAAIFFFMTFGPGPRTAVIDRLGAVGFLTTSDGGPAKPPFHSVFPAGPSASPADGPRMPPKSGGRGAGCR